MSARFFCFCVGLLLLSACGARVAHRPSPPLDPVMTITVFDDGFHSGFIVPYAGMPIELDLARVQSADAPPFVEIGFGEAKWMQNIDRSFLHEVRISLWPSEGMLLLVNLPDRTHTDEALPKTRYWDVSFTEKGKIAFYAELERWLDRSQIYVRPPSDPQFFYRSSRNYILLRDCHDFTLDMLRAAGFPLGSRLANTSGSLDRQIARGLSLLQKHKIAAIGP